MGKQFNNGDYVDGNRVSRTGQEFWKSGWRKKLGHRGLETKSPWSEKTHLQKEAVNLDLMS